MAAHLSNVDADLLLSAHHGDPFSVLGRHVVEGQEIVRIFRPDAKQIEVIDSKNPGISVSANKVHANDFFEAKIDGIECYHLRITWQDETVCEQADPYSFGSFFGDLDRYLFSEGTHYELYHKLGAQWVAREGIAGVNFAVWAPNARRVSVVGDFNCWDGRIYPMRKLTETGIWEIFIPGLPEKTHYKFEILNTHGEVVLKSDPVAFYAQNGKQTASLVFDLKRYQWRDAAWMANRKNKNWQHEPVNIYEVHLGSWVRVPEEENRSLSYRELAERLIPYVLEMGYTHIELMAIAEHPFDGSWGYQVTGYFAPTSRFGNPDDFRHFIDHCHQAGIGVILDWVPGHFPKDAHGLAKFDGTCLYEHNDPRQGEHRDWGTLIFNYGRNEVRNFLIANALFWLSEYHIDGLRVDAVASMLYLDYSREEGEWITNFYGGRENLEAIAFLRVLNEVCYARFSGIMTIAEESTSWPGVSKPTYDGGLGFNFKWNMGWMNDSLRYIARDPIYRRYHQNDLTFSLVYAFSEHFILVLSHDEVVHGKGSMLEKMPGDRWQKFANLRMFYAWMLAHPGKKLMFQGCEFGQSAEWKYDQSLDWHLLQYPEHDGLHRLVQHLNYLYKKEPAFWEKDDSCEGFEWIDFNDHDHSILAFLRRANDGSFLVFVMNATPTVHKAYRIGVPSAGFYEEIVNTDAQTYGGSNIGNLGGVDSEKMTWHNREYSICLDLPPLACIGLKWHI